MRNLHLLDIYRRTDRQTIQFFGSTGDAETGVFDIPHPKTAVVLMVLATSGEGWDHVSVSLRNRCPNWAEMEHVKRLFFNDDETAMQLHVPPSDHINCHPYCLHLWRPIAAEIPRPPAWMVGPVAKEASNG